ncbi:MAG: HD domain-containing protein [Desulfobacteraceae bacterium]|nr:HD domain-containing protein [Desulfobacteraceae bacterium]
MDILKYFDKTNHRFRDPIYGFIEVNDSELKIIDSPIFQRLRRIHQLALTKYIYPTAEHSRFTHSLGVLQSATNIFLNIYKNSGYNKELFSSENKNIEQDIAKQLQILRFTALLHDIGHLPFSHAAEKLILEDKATHETLGQYIIENYEPIKRAIQEKNIKPSTVSMLLGDQFPIKYHLLKNIISGQLDADRADYLLRDSYACGVKYGEYDYNRYIKSFSLKKREAGPSQLCVNEKNIYLIESFLMARYHYNLQVPYHRTRVGYDIVLKKYIETLKENDKFPNLIKYGDSNEILDLDFDKFEMFDDYSIFENIKESYKSNENIWSKLLMRQDHLKPFFDHIQNDTGETQQQFKHILVRLKESGYEENNDFFKYKKKLEVSKLLKQTDECDDNSIGLIIEGKDEPENILHYSNILAQLVKPIEIFRIYTTKDNFEKTSNLSKEVINYLKKVDKE